jgi:hypothetical protein
VLQVLQFSRYVIEQVRLGLAWPIDVMYVLD